MVQPDGYVKKIRNIGMDLRRTVVVDDTPLSYRENPENALPIRKWDHSQYKDDCLIGVLDQIRYLQHKKDIRKALAEPR